MSDEPTTRPTAMQIARELDAIRAAQDVNLRWERMLVGQARLESAIENFHASLEAHKKDDKEFQAEMREQYGTVTSSVNDVREAGSITVRQAIAGLMTLLIAVGGWIVALWAKK